MPESDRNAPHVKGSGDDQFAEKLEAVDRKIASDIHDHDREDQSLASDLAQAAGVLELLNRVRQREPATDPNRHDHSNTLPEKTRAADSAATDARPRIETSRVSQHIGPYEILEQIARGGMGIVFRARDSQLGRIVALKMMLAGPFAYEEERKRFRVEAEAAAQLDHPGIVPVYDVGEHAGQLYFTMGLVDGESLSHRIRQKPLAARTAAELACQIAAAVHYAHDQGVIHRDIKPANVLLDGGDRARITDFGLARRTDSVSDLTGTEQVLGTPSYMAPEQASGNAAGAGPLADVYAIGATLYCMITGRPPFQAPSPAETLRMVIDQEPVAPRQLNPSIPIDLNTICVKCLQKEPHRRYQSAAELEAELHRFLDHIPIEARPVSVAERAWKWSRRHPRVAGLSAAFAIALVAIIAGGAWYQTQLNQTLVDLKTSRAEAVDHLYRSLTGEAEFLTEVRPLGYGPRVRSLIAQAQELDTTQNDLHQLRQLAVSGLGYIGARQPIEFPELDSPVRSASVINESNHLAVGLESGDLVLFDLATGRLDKRLDVLDIPVVRVDVDSQNLGQDGKRIRVTGEFARQIAEVVLAEDGSLTLQSVDTPELPDGFLGLETTPDGRHLIGVQSAPESLAAIHNWISPSTLVLGNDIGAGRRRPDDAEPIHFAVASLVDSGQPARVLAAPMSPRLDVNDHYLVVGKSWLDLLTDDSIVVYDHHTGEVTQELNASCGALLNVRISPNGQYVAAGSDYGFEIFERYSGQRIARNDDLGSCIIESFIGDDGDVLVRTDRESLWYSPGHLQPLARFPAGGDTSLLKFSNDGRYMIWTGTRTPKVVDTRGNQRIRIAGHSRIAKSVSFSPDGRLVISSTQYYGGNLSRVWDAASGELKFEFVGSESAFSPDGRWIACWSGGLKLWDVASGQLVARDRHDPFPATIRFSAAGDRLVVASRFAGQFGVWAIEGRSVSGPRGGHDAASPIRLRRVFAEPSASCPVAFSPSGRRVAYGREGVLRVHDLENDRPLATIDPAGNLRLDSVAFLDDERLLVIAGELQMWDVAKAERTWSSEQRHHPPLVLSPDRTHLLCRRTLLRCSDFSEIFRLPAWLGSAASSDWSADGRKIAYGLDRGDVTVWDLDAVQDALGSQGLPWDEIAFSPANASESITAMIRLGTRHAGQFDPQQWEYRYRTLIDQMQKETGRDWIVRETNWLAERLDRIATRPFFEPSSSDAETLQRMRDVYNLAGKLQQLQEHDAEQTILKAMQQAFEAIDLPTPELTRQASLLYHTSGDLHNFFHPSEQICMDAYAAEEKLIDHLINHPDQPQSRDSLSTSLFWLNRNLAMAHRRFGAAEKAIERMEAAIGIAEEFPDLQIDQSTIKDTYPMLAGWLQEAGRNDEADAILQRANTSSP